MEDVRRGADDGDPSAHDEEVPAELLVRRGLVRPPRYRSEVHPPILSLLLLLRRLLRRRRPLALRRWWLW